MKPAGATLDAAFETMMEGVLIALLVFTPLVFGAVQTWAVSMMQAGVAVLCGAWLCRFIWCRPARGTLWRYLFPRTGLGAPIAVFLGLVLLQLAPMPPRLTRLLSPAAAETFSRSLPGYAEGGRVDFRRLEPWLLENHVEGGADSAILQDPAPIPLAGGVDFSPLRPLSIYPFATWGRLLMLAALLGVFLVVTQCVS
ncbi:MAG TPA: hypothetical protein VFG76_08935, partial [Candidatus Polarisedimenticolia bacterium]|nr:hypothetical protein [Candidatus Polarisedimenticolia bacterium]